MANTTFNGPVRSEGGFEQITKNSTTGAVTNNFDVDTSGNISGSGTMKMTGAMNYVKDVESLTAATKTVTSADSGTVYLINRAAGVVVDRKSTRLNSSHGYISYAVFCLNKKKKKKRKKI